MSEWAERLTALCRGDGEFNLMARYWTGTLRLGLGDETVELDLRDGEVAGGHPLATPTAAVPDEPGHVGVAAPSELWDQILAPVPPPFCNDVVPAQALGLVVSGHELTFWQYYPAIRRMVELLRADRGATADAGAR